MSMPKPADELQRQRQRLRAVMDGHPPRPCHDIETAKARLREVAGELPVGPLLHAVNRRRWSDAALQLGLLLLPALLPAALARLDLSRLFIARR